MHPQEIRNVSLRLGTLDPRRRPRSGNLTLVPPSAIPRPKAPSREIPHR